MGLEPYQVGMIGVVNSFVGSGCSACGYCLQKLEHNKREADPTLPPAEKQPRFLMGYVLLVVGAVSSVANFGLLGQSAQAPFAALTLGYNALLSAKYLGEPYTRTDFLSMVLMCAGVGVCVASADLEEESYDLDVLLDLFIQWRPFVYTLLVLGSLGSVHLYLKAREVPKNQVRLAAYGITAGMMAGFTGLTVKSSIEIVAGAFDGSGDMGRYETYLIIICLPCALGTQLFWLNQGLKTFDALLFVPIYQSMIIVGNLMSGIVYFDEFAGYTDWGKVQFVAGCLITVSGVLVLLMKASAEDSEKEEGEEADEAQHPAHARRRSSLPYGGALEMLALNPEAELPADGEVPVLTFEDHMQRVRLQKEVLGQAGNAL